MTGITLGRSLALVTTLAMGMAQTAQDAPRRARPGRGGGASEAPARASEDSPPSAAQAPPARSRATAWAKVDVTVYAITLDPAKISGDEIGALARHSGSSADFDKALAAIGVATPTQRVCQSVPADGSLINVSVSANKPTAALPRRSTASAPAAGVQYQDVGAKLTFRIDQSSHDDKTAFQFQIGGEFSNTYSTSVSVSEGSYAPQFTRLRVSHEARVESGGSTLCAAFNADPLTSEGKATGCIIRATISE